MHDAAFAAAARPARIKILGLPMQPYSIGHELLLIQQFNPLLSDPEFFSTLAIEDQNQAVILAALICCNSWRQNQKPHRNLRLWKFFHVRRFGVNIADFKTEADKFRAYRTGGTSLPPVPDERAEILANGVSENEGRQAGGPFTARLLNFVSQFSQSDVHEWGESLFDYPFGLAAWRYIAALEMDGAMRIENPKEFKIRNEIEEKERQYKEAKCQP